jgi:4,5-DOPA dioxygenase extradiol
MLFVAHDTDVGAQPMNEADDIRMPVLFLGHGSPMNAIEDNGFSRSLVAMAAGLPATEAVLVVSAHWMTPGSTRVLSAARPRTIHDFYGFPRELYGIEYPAPGSPALATDVSRLTGAVLDDTWGLDHASWAVLRHVFPAADVPVFELSLDMSAPPAAHVELGRLLAPLRDRGVLVVGSGNIVHNLAAVRWSEDAEPYDWALEFDHWVAERLEDGDVDGLASYAGLGGVATNACPTADHYLPMLYVAAMADPGEAVTFFHEGVDLGSVSMRCARWG